MTARVAEVPLASRVHKLAPVPTLAMALRAKALRASGRSVLDFSVGEPDQDTPPHIVAAARAALEAGETRYAPPSGLLALRQAVVENYRRDFQTQFEPGQVTIATGGKHALYLACQALLGAGDELLVPTPYWPTFPEAARLAGAKPRFLALEEERGFQLTARAVTRALSSRTRAIVVNSPSNPTGVSVPPEELLAIGRLARRRGVTLLYDDTYAWLQHEPRPPGLLEQLRRAAGERLVVVGTASKTHCMTGWRVGWLIGTPGLARAAAALVSHSTQGPATFAQLAAVRALTGPQDHVRRMVAEYRSRRDLAHGTLAGSPGVSCVKPDGGFYVFPNLSRLLSRALPSTLVLAERLLEETGVAVVPGEGFGLPGHFRLSFARPTDELRQGLQRISDFLAELT